MKSASPARIVSPAEFDSRLNSYSKTALAVAAVGALGTADAAAQTTVKLISAVNSTPTEHGSIFSFQFETNEVGLIVRQYTGQKMSIWGNGVAVGGAVGSRNWYLSISSNFVARELVALPKSARIDASNAELFFGGSFVVAGPLASGTHPWTGQFVNATGYLAFQANGYFGWLRAHGTLVGNAVTLEFVPKEGTTDIYGAYARGGILAGQTVAAVPEPATVATSLGLLALGAAGVREFRRRRKSEATA